jgi:hypothetical protein
MGTLRLVSFLLGGERRQARLVSVGGWSERWLACQLVTSVKTISGMTAILRAAMLGLVGHKRTRGSVTPFWGVLNRYECDQGLDSTLKMLVTTNSQ